MVTVVDIPSNATFNYPDAPATIDGVASVLSQFCKDVSKRYGRYRDLARAWTEDRDHFIVIATESKDGR